MVYSWLYWIKMVFMGFQSNLPAEHEGTTQEKSYVKPLFFILLTALILSGGGYKGYQRWYQSQTKIRNSKDFLISGVFQTGIKKEAISSTQLAEMMGLSVDQPIHILDFDEKKIEKKLLSYPVFKEVQIHKKKPSSVYVDYQVRQPIAIVKDFKDSVIDDEAVIFPYRQFFSQKLLPQVYLGAFDLNQFEEKKQLSLKVLKLVEEMLNPAGFKILTIDVSSAFIDSFSKREIVLTIEQDFNKIPFQYFLRLNILEVEKQISNFLVLNKELIKQQKLWAKLSQSGLPKPKVIDLRLEGMALIE